MTVPAAAAWTVVFSFAAILIPLYFMPLGCIPNRVITGPRTGHAKRPLSMRISPCGSSALWAASGFLAGGGVTAVRSFSAASVALAEGAGAGGFAAICSRAADGTAASGLSGGLAAGPLEGGVVEASVFSAGPGGACSRDFPAAAGPRSVPAGRGRSVMLSSFTFPGPPAAAAAGGRALSGDAATAAGFSAGGGAGGFASAACLAGGMSTTSGASGTKTTLPALIREESVMLLISASSCRSMLYALEMRQSVSPGLTRWYTPRMRSEDFRLPRSTTWMEQESRAAPRKASMRSFNMVEMCFIDSFTSPEKQKVRG